MVRALRARYGLTSREQTAREPPAAAPDVVRAAGLRLEVTPAVPTARPPSLRRRRQVPYAELRRHRRHEPRPAAVHDDPIALRAHAELLAHAPVLADRQLDVLVDHPLQEPRTVGEAVPLLDDQVERLVLHLQGLAARSQPCRRSRRDTCCAMRRTSGFVSGANSTTSSMRFRNSGGKRRSSSRMTSPFDGRRIDAARTRSRAGSSACGSARSRGSRS